MWEIIISIIGVIIIGEITLNFLNKKIERDETIKIILKCLIKINESQQKYNDTVHKNITLDDKESTRLTIMDLNLTHLIQDIKNKIAQL